MRRPLIPCLILVATCLCQGEEKLSLAEILELHGKPLFDAANRAIEWNAASLSPADLLALTEKLADEANSLPRDDVSGYALNRAFTSACQQATGPAVDRLCAVYARLEPGDWRTTSLIAPLAASWLNREFAVLRSEKITLALPEDDPELPPHLVDAPTDLQQSWRLYKKATQAYDKTFAQQRDTISYQRNENAFHQLVVDALTGSGEGTAEKLARCEWSGGCGTGSDTLYEPRTIAVFIALLRERRIPEAVGACIAIHGREPLVFGKDENNARIEYLKLCGLDWESIFAGAQVDRDGGASLPQQDMLLREMAAAGGDRTAVLLAQIARRATPAAREAYARALSVMIEPEGRTGVVPLENGSSMISSLDWRRNSKVHISRGNRAELLRVLSEFSSPTAPTDLAYAALIGFARAADKDTAPALRVLAGHPSDKVKQAATRVLRAIGEDAPVQAKLGPVRFRVLVNGQPLDAGTTVDWMVEYGGGGSTSSSIAVGDDGVVPLERELFLSPDRKPSSVVIHTRRSDDAAASWWAAIVSPPDDLAELTAVMVQLCPVTLIVHAPRNRPQPASLELEMNRSAEETNRYFAYASRNLTATPDQPLTLPSVQIGTYEVQIRASGFELVRQKVAVAPGIATVHLAAQPGSDVRVAIVLPNGSNDYVPLTLFRDGTKTDQRFDFKEKMFRGLPLGDYVLHIASTEETLPYAGASQLGPDQIANRARDVAFTIDEDSPPVIDLGEIRVESVTP